MDGNPSIVVCFGLGSEGNIYKAVFSYVYLLLCTFFLIACFFIPSGHRMRPG